jgi:Glycosyl hydrolase family 65 central catalytic domain
VRDRRGQLVPVLTGELEERVVADVAWAAACYTEWTGDHAFAAAEGRELIVQTARWWAARIERDPDGRGHVRGVIGPDEYHAGVDNDAFTNVMARWNLRHAAAVGAGAVAERERSRWLELAEVIVDGHDPHTGVYEQFAGFHALEPLLIAEIAPRRPVAADVLLGATSTSTSRAPHTAARSPPVSTPRDWLEPGGSSMRLRCFASLPVSTSTTSETTRRADSTWRRWAVPGVRSRSVLPDCGRSVTRSQLIRCWRPVWMRSSCACGSAGAGFASRSSPPQ